MDSSLKIEKRKIFALKFSAYSLIIVSIGLLMISCAYFIFQIFNFKIAIICGVSSVVIASFFSFYISKKIKYKDSMLRTKKLLIKSIKKDKNQIIDERFNTPSHVPAQTDLHKINKLTQSIN